MVQGNNGTLKNYRSMPILGCQAPMHTRPVYVRQFYNKSVINDTERNRTSPVRCSGSLCFLRICFAFSSLPKARWSFAARKISSS